MMRVRFTRTLTGAVVLALLLGVSISFSATISAQTATMTPGGTEATPELTPEATLDSIGEATPELTPAVTPNADVRRIRVTGEFIAQVAVDSVFARALPTRDVEATTSLFEDEWVEVVGRNLDGTWFEVRRPARMTNLGWVLAEYLDWEFRPERLPLTDFMTGVVGPQPLTRAEPFAVFILESVILRAQPLRSSPRLGSVPPLVTIPVLARNQDGSWLLVNHLGYQGWVNAASTRHSLDLSLVFEPSDLPPLENVPRLIIPVELQQAQIDRLRAYIDVRLELATGLEGFWWRVYRGETMPCDAPPQIAFYPYGESDVRELPELQRYVPQLAQAVEALSVARAPLLQCGVIAPEATVDARNAAINARVLFEAVLERVNDLEENVVQTRR